MVEMKTRRVSAKRLRRIGAGKLRRYETYRSHITDKKSSRRIRNLRKGSLVSRSDQKCIDHMIP